MKPKSSELNLLLKQKKLLLNKLESYKFGSERTALCGCPSCTYVYEKLNNSEYIRNIRSKIRAVNKKTKTLK